MTAASKLLLSIVTDCVHDTTVQVLGEAQMLIDVKANINQQNINVILSTCDNSTLHDIVCCSRHIALVPMLV